MRHPDSSLMLECIELAKQSAKNKQYALGALVVDENGTILSEQNSKLIASYDPTAHPEILAIRESAEIRKSRYLEGCYLYTTLEPCPMCTSAVIWAKMKGIVFGAYQGDAISFSKQNKSKIFTWRQITVPSSEIAKNGEPLVKIYPGFLREECIKLFELTTANNV